MNAHPSGQPRRRDHVTQIGRGPLPDLKGMHLAGKVWGSAKEQRVKAPIGADVVNDGETRREVREQAADAPGETMPAPPCATVAVCPAAYRRQATPAQAAHGLRSRQADAAQRRS